MALKFYTSERNKWKLANFGGLIPTFVEVAGEKIVGGVLFALSPSWIGLMFPYTTFARILYLLYIALAPVWHPALMTNFIKSANRITGWLWEQNMKKKLFQNLVERCIS